MKRFTETEKWRDPWFRRLSSNAKLAYFYILDNADNAGVWQVDQDMANFQIGATLDWAAIQAELGDRIHELCDGSKWLVTRFISFQFGTLMPDCKPHQQVLRLISQHQIERVCKGYPKGNHTLKDKDKDKDKDQDKDKDGGAGEGLERIWGRYPKKTGKQAALPEIAKAIKAHGVEYIEVKTRAYAEAVAKWSPEDRKFIPDPVRWFKRGNYEDDPTAWERNATPGNRYHQPAATAADHAQAERDGAWGTPIPDIPHP